MKKYLFFIIITLLVFLNCSCTQIERNDDIGNKMNTSNTSISSDGILNSINRDELITILSKLNTTTTMDDVVNYFGKYPKMDIEANSDTWEYFWDDITIAMQGINLQNGNLYRVTVSCKSSYISLDLTDKN